MWPKRKLWLATATPLLNQASDIKGYINLFSELAGPRLNDDDISNIKEYLGTKSPYDDEIDHEDLVTKVPRINVRLDKTQPIEPWYLLDLRLFQTFVGAGTLGIQSCAGPVRKILKMIQYCRGMRTPVLVPDFTFKTGEMH